MEIDSTLRGDVLAPQPSHDKTGCNGLLKRLFIVRTEAMTHGHFNASLNTYVSGNRDFDEKLKRESERVSLYQGTEARFERVDPTDKKALGVTDQGLEESNRIRSKQGLPTFKV
jgi:hypothetical protein